MQTPNKSDWFVEWLEEKFDTIKTLIEDNRLNHTEDREKLYEKIDEVDAVHTKKHKETRLWFVVALVLSSFVFIKESRDLIIKLFF